MTMTRPPRPPAPVLFIRLAAPTSLPTQLAAVPRSFARRRVNGNRRVTRRPVGAV